MHRVRLENSEGKSPFARPRLRREDNINPLKTKRRLLYLKTESVPCSKQFSSEL